MLIFRLLHIMTSIWFISGLLGRGLTFRQAGQASDLRAASALMRASERFERLMVRPGSLVVLLLGLLTAWLQGQPVLGFLQGATTNWLLVSLLLSFSIVPIIILVLIPRGKLRARAL